MKPIHHRTQNPGINTALVILIIAILTGILLSIKSTIDFSHSGPQIREEVMKSYLLYAIYGVTRLAVWSAIIAALISSAGIFIYHCLSTIFNWKYRWYFSFLAGSAAVALITTLQFLRHLLFIPASIMASFNYRPSRLYPIWDKLSPELIQLADWTMVTVFISIAMICIIRLLYLRQVRHAIIILVTGSIFLTIASLFKMETEPSPANLPVSQSDRPNIIMIGSDSLRADRLGQEEYHRSLTPFIDRLSKQGLTFSQAIIPLARTAPSMVALMTGTWPHTNGVRSNYIADSDSELPVPNLASLLSDNGYATAAVGDWAASDLGKFNFGFNHYDIASDQWNFKYLLRQGPKDIRLFLSLFTQNRLGKLFLPEIYYLAGIPLSKETGLDTRQMIKRLSNYKKPFFINTFIASTHGPFGSAYPYYTLYANSEYKGESRFSMAGLSSPEEVVAKQGLGKVDFDVQQIIDLYDGAVSSFDKEVENIMAYLKSSHLDKNTIVVIYSDHGVDLFEGETWGQANILSDYSYRVPLIIIDPRNPRTARITTTVRTIDIAPTLLQLTGTPIPPSMEGESLPGLTNESTGKDRPAFMETGLWLAANIKGLPEERIQYPSILNLLEIKEKSTGSLSIKPRHLKTAIRAKSRAVRKGRWQLVYFPLNDGHTYKLYDMYADPAMQVDVTEKYSEIAAQLRHLLDDWMIKSEL